MSSENAKDESRSLALTPTWAVAILLTVLVVVSLIVERSIHRLVNWLKKVNRKPLLAAVEKMKEELMLLGFISLLLTATSNAISNICIPSKFYNGGLHPCSKPDNNQHINDSKRRLLNEFDKKICKKNYEPFVSYEGLEQLHRFIFVMAVTHISYSCLTMILAVMKIRSWRKWEDDAQMDRHGVLSEISRNEIMRRQSAILKVNMSSPLVRNGFFTWMVCFFRQFGSSVVRADYLMLREAFIMNHNLTSTYDFHRYMIRSMEEEFQMIVGLCGPLWGLVVAFMLFNVKGSNLYFWISLIPVALVLLLGAKLQHVIATLALESAAITGYFTKARLKPRDELFWFKKPELLLSLVHFILFQNAFELASFFWFWWQFGYNSCFLKQHMMVYIRLILGFGAQFLCSYSTLPLYALVTQMGTNHKAALIPERIRETIQCWRKEAKRRRKMGVYSDYSTVQTETCTVVSLEDFDHQELHSPPTEAAPGDDLAVELHPPALMTPGAPRLRPSVSVCSVSPSFMLETVTRSFSLPTRKQ
ncbi:MLO-like protein 11 [Bidens hawaiensis]|uniref:MLO-like protein 11 n=1 Tax=Bidens hawaiensis TaxID=980011 RepID=UPI0040497B97